MTKYYIISLCYIVRDCFSTLETTTFGTFCEAIRLDMQEIPS